MSKQYPNGCDCCQDEHMEEEDYKPLTWQDVPAANPEQAKVWLGLVNGIFDKYPGKTMNLPALKVMVAQGIPGLRPENYTMVTLQVERLIRESSAFELRKGKSGGVYRSALAPAPVYMDLTPATNVPDMITGKLPDNYTCKGCGNTKLNRTEKSCWSCGRQVGT